MLPMKRIVYLLFCTYCLFSCAKKSEDNSINNIKNNVFWDTSDGLPIYSQGGGIFKFKQPGSDTERYYWYGAHYIESEYYRNDPSITQDKSRFKAVTCYSSLDLVNWEFEADVLTQGEIDENAEITEWVGRLGVAYLEETGKYAMFVQHNDGVLIAISDTPTAPFKWHRRIDMTDRIGTPNTGDQTVFTDEDTGKSYLIYSYGRGRNRIYVSEIGIKDDMVDLLDCTQVFSGQGREGNCMFKYNNKYYLYASNLYGWDSSYAYYLIADDIRGPYLPEKNMHITKGCEADYSHVTQTGFFINVKGSKEETVIYCGDRWAAFAGNGLGYNQWIPISFDEEEPYFNSISSWNLNHITGEWHVADDNNYVKNGSFEADRRHIPSIAKPVQLQLTGWQTDIIKGNVISLESVDSPVLNYFNTREDRMVVIGEKSLNISDKVDFERKISQTITSSKYVELKDGLYTMTAKVRNTEGFLVLEMYAKSGEDNFTSDIKLPKSKWQEIALTNIKVVNGSVEIGFNASGVADAFCTLFDIAFV